MAAGARPIGGQAIKRFRAYVPEDEGHDDLLIADMLLVDAAYSAGLPRTMKTGTVNFYG